MSIDVYRLLSRGEYINDFSFLNNGSAFPSKEISGRNVVYRWRHKEYTGEYSYNKNIVAYINGVRTEIPYRLISTNYFRLIADKMTDIVFGTDFTVRTGDVARDKKVLELVDKFGWRDSIRKAFKMCVTYGDCCMKTYKSGVSVFAPTHAFKVVDKHDINRTIAYCLYEYLYENSSVGVNKLSYIRFEIHMKGKIFEIVKRYNGNIYGGTVGESVAYRINNRLIPKDGALYNSGVEDCDLVQWLSVNVEADGLYGQSCFQDIQDIVFVLEERLSINSHCLDASIKPFLVVGMDCVERTEKEDGSVETHLKLINGNIMVSSGDFQAKSIELNYNLDNSFQMISVLQSYLYELSEMGKTYLSGEYTGNISEETLGNTIKSAIDKGNRLITEMYTGFRDSLYCLCRLNNIDIRKEDITLSFAIGRTDDDMTVAEVCEKLIASQVLSRKTLREKFWGFNEEQSESEDEQIKKESEHIEKKTEPIDQQLIKNDNRDNELEPVDTSRKM